MDARLKIGVKKNGAITALKTECILEGGPISGIGPFNIYYFGAFMNIRTRFLPLSTMGSWFTQTVPPADGAGQEIVLAQFASILSFT